MWLITSVVFSATLFELFSLGNSDVILELPKGKIKGRTETTYHNITFYAFQEIPFGRPPLGDLRFKAPQPAESWEGVLDCTSQSKVCIAVKHDNPMENEDCLYLNVFTPVEPGSDATLPVIFYIYGGSFDHGNNDVNRFGPQFLIEEGVVIVTTNYRVGPLGFLSTGDTVIPGNNGLKDQLLALEWVQENIQLFGGDPSKVTIMGQSAGGASVTYHILSQQSKGLFRAAVVQSGSALNPWAYQRHSKDIAYLFAAEFDSSFNASRSSEELLELLQSIPAEDIAKVFVDFIPQVGGEGFTWSPTIEPEHETAFLTEKQYGLLESGNINQVPIVIGICSEEEIQKAADMDSLQKLAENYDKDVRILVNEDLHLTDDVALSRVGDQIRKIYTEEFASNLTNAVRFYSDNSFTRAVIRFAEMHSQLADVYFYQFSYYGGMSGFTEIDLPGAGKVAHNGDTYFLWTKDNKTDLDEFSKDDILTSQRYVKLLADFSKYLNPTPEQTTLLQDIEWPKVNSTHFWYLDIDKDLEVKLNPKGESYSGWVEVYDTWAIKPYDTY